MKKLLITSLLLVSSSVFAQQAAPEAGPKIEGGVKMNIVAKDTLNAAVGTDSSASQSIGAVESGDIKGGVNLNIGSVDSLDAAVGTGSCADQQIGTIGKASSCK